MSSRRAEPTGPFRRRPARLVWGLCACWLAACESTLALGSECLQLDHACEKLGTRTGGPADGGPGDAGAGIAVDASGGSASDAQASALPDGGVPSAGLGIDPGIQNPSFELQNGSSAGDFGATTPLSNTDISPWYQCQVPGASFLRVETSDDGAAPTHGKTFMTFQFPYYVTLFVPVYQTLSTPLKKGQQYAFLVDVRADGANSDRALALDVRGGNVHCGALARLAVTDYLPTGSWQTRCIRFTPDQDYTQISLVPAVKLDVAVTYRLFVDNIRTDPSCQ
jgi:hypothetical protein